ISLEIYEQVNPGRYAKLKMLKQAEGFPLPVLAYLDGGLEDATLAKVKKGMVEAHTTIKGKEQLAQWKLSGFEDVPADYEAKLTDILKRYPPKAK
ncbi:MAG TPA: hypothetical protein VE988_02965, partial [Gemmataceae bacterium]|nr:hypothetical protein [Gemmataceae bacterium]